MRKRYYLQSAILFFTAFELNAHADGLADLRSALDRLSSPSTFTATVEANVWNANGDGDDRFEIQGEAGVKITDAEPDLQLSYSHTLLAQMDEDEKARNEDPNAKTPTLEAVESGLRLPDLRSMISSSAHLRRQIDGAEFESEKSATLRGEPARVLTFKRDLSTVSERQRKYVKNFDSTLKIWIDDAGTPLQSHALMELSGRAFIFIRFNHKEEEEAHFAEENGRLVTLKSEFQSESAGGGENHESKIVRTLKVSAD